MVLTLQHLAVLPFGEEWAGAVAANIIEGSELTVVASNHQNGVARHLCGETFPWLSHPGFRANVLPIQTEHLLQVKVMKSRMPVPAGGNSGSSFERFQPLADLLMFGIGRVA